MPRRKKVVVAPTPTVPVPVPESPAIPAIAYWLMMAAASAALAAGAGAEEWWEILLAAVGGFLGLPLGRFGWIGVRRIRQSMVPRP